MIEIHMLGYITKLDIGIWIVNQTMLYVLIFCIGVYVGATAGKDGKNV